MNYALICLGALIVMSFLSVAWSVYAARQGDELDMEKIPIVRNMKSLSLVFQNVSKTVRNPFEHEHKQYQDLAKLINENDDINKKSGD